MEDLIETVDHMVDEWKEMRVRHRAFQHLADLQAEAIRQLALRIAYIKATLKCMAP